MTRPTILIAWELGANFGHAAMIAALVRDLGDADIVIAARDAALVRRLVGGAARVIAAPDVAAPPPDEETALHYPDVLRQSGWHDPATLARRIDGWSDLIDRENPDVIATEAAPTALLAAKGKDAPTAVFGNGWSAPPLTTPMPAFLHWQEIELEELARREDAVLATVNEALNLSGRSPVAAIAEALTPERTLLTTFAEVDHYDPRPSLDPEGPPYLGSLGHASFGEALNWSKETAFHIFAYLQPDAPAFQPMLLALSDLQGETEIIVAAPGAPVATQKAMADTSVRLIAGPVDFTALLADCHLGISHASSGMAEAFVVNNVPQIGLPNHTEQAIVAHALWRNRLALSHIGPASQDDCAALIAEARSEPDMAEAATRIAAREAKRPRGAAAAAIMGLAEGA